MAQSVANTPPDKTPDYVNEEQLRHAKAMALKIASQAQSIVNAMNWICGVSLGERGMDKWPLQNLINRFKRDGGMGLEDRINSMETIVKDMIGHFDDYKR